MVELVWSEREQKERKKHFALEGAVEGHLGQKKPDKKAGLSLGQNPARMRPTGALSIFDLQVAIRQDRLAAQRLPGDGRRDRLRGLMETVERAMERAPAGQDPQAARMGFWALIVTQFQVAFSDNALKWLVSFLVLETGASREQRDFLFVLVVPLVFAVPFLVFSIPGGYFADRFSKRSVTICTKLLEVLTMLSATYALWQNRLDLAAVALFFCVRRVRFSGRPNTV